MNNTEWIGKDVLFTCDKWFYAPDGKTYNAVWGTLKGIHKIDDLFGFSARVTSNMANYVFEVGNIAIAGCQVHYAVLCPESPPQGDIKNWAWSDVKGELVYYERPSSIYSANVAQTI